MTTEESLYSRCKSHPGFYECERDYHAKVLKNGTFSLYEGCWANTRCSTGYLAVVRGADGKPRHFPTLVAIHKYINQGR